LATGSKNQRRPKRQSAKGRLSRRLPATSKNNRRVKRLFLPLLFSGLTITLRSFKTPKSRRSKKYKQLVLPVYFLDTREIAVRFARLNFRRKFGGQAGRKSTRRRLVIRVGSRQWRVQTVATVLLITVGIAGSIFFAAQIKPAKIELTGNHVPTQAITTSTAASTASTLPRSEPTHLRIAKVNIDTDLTSIGRNPDDTIEVPKDYHMAGWYRYSPTPGELGPSIIVGHVDNVRGLAVFWHLHELSPGDVVEITRADSQTHTFKIDDVKQFPRDSFPTQEVYGNIDHAGLRLITCGGVFNTQTHEYSHNTVVYASLVN